MLNAAVRKFGGEKTEEEELCFDLEPYDPFSSAALAASATSSATSSAASATSSAASASSKLGPSHFSNKCALRIPRETIRGIYVKTRGYKLPPDIETTVFCGLIEEHISGGKRFFFEMSRNTMDVISVKALEKSAQLGLVTPLNNTVQQDPKRRRRAVSTVETKFTKPAKPKND